MVFQGPSRGCNSCRHRRKKCDETRPSCIRCTRAGRTCGGYEDNGASAYHRSEIKRADATAFMSIARKCSLPPRVPIPGTHLVQDDVIPAETSECESNSLALRAFLYQFCVVPTNRDLSQGYLSGLEMMVRRSGLKSDLVKACQAVSFAIHGKPLNRPMVVDKAATFYHELIASLAKAIQDPDVSSAKVTRMIVMLLGLYQMVMASEEDYGCHVTHARGLAALMGLGDPPSNVLGKDPFDVPLDDVSYMDRVLAQGSQKLGIFSAPALCNGGRSLNELTLSYEELKSRFRRTVTLDDMKALRDGCIALDGHFAVWQSSRVPEFMPTDVGQIGRTTVGQASRVGCWPGRVDTYFDLYVAGVWNIFRSTRLQLITLITTLSAALGEQYARHLRDATSTVEDLIASVPYHLTEDLPAFVRQAQVDPTEGVLVPGRFLGGLLLMHPLYAASQMDLLPAKMRKYLRDCLLWISSHMGIGQAAVLANVRAPLLSEWVKVMASDLTAGRLRTLTANIWPVAA